MKKTFPLPALLACLLIAGICTVASNTFAGAPPSDSPPKMDPLDEGDPAVTNSKDNKKNQTEQLIENGQAREVKVTNGVGTYVIKPNSNVGTSLPGDAQSNSSSPAQWVIKSWGGSKSTEPVDAAAPVLPTNPNPSTSK